jgi:hypothetical protein
VHVIRDNGPSSHPLQHLANQEDFHVDCAARNAAFRLARILVPESFRRRSCGQELFPSGEREPLNLACSLGYKQTTIPLMPKPLLCCMAGCAPFREFDGGTSPLGNLLIGSKQVRG